jgi:hypothetical protein
LVKWFHQKCVERLATKKSSQDFVEGAKPSEAQWYSVKSLQKGIPSLADLLEVLSENLQIILMKAGIGNLSQRDKLFSFQLSKFEIFCYECMLQDACETTSWPVKGLKLKGLKFKQWFVRLGTDYLGELADPGVNGRAPWVQNICPLQKDFIHTISRLASQQEIEAAGWPAPEENMTGDCDMEQEDPQESDLVLLWVKRILLTLLLKEEYLNTYFWASNVDPAAVGAVLHLIVTQMQQHRDDDSLLTIPKSFARAYISQYQRKLNHITNAQGILWHLLVPQDLELWLKSRTIEGANSFKCVHFNLSVTIKHSISF